MQTLSSILRDFKLVSGLKVIFFRSSLAGIGIEHEELHRYTSILLMNLPFSYLGMPVGGNSRRECFWEPILNKLRGRLAK